MDDTGCWWIVSVGNGNTSGIAEKWSTKVEPVAASASKYQAKNCADVVVPAWAISDGLKALRCGTQLDYSEVDYESCSRTFCADQEAHTRQWGSGVRRKRLSMSAPELPYVAGFPVPV